MNAREIERKLIRKLAKAKAFLTVTGKAQSVKEITTNEITFTTAAGSKTNKIKRSKLRKAISFFTDVKTVTRKQLEAFTAFTSALFGLLKTLNVRVSMTASGMIRITLQGVRYVFAGVDRSPRDMRIAAAQGAKHFLMSYYSIKDRKAWKQHALDLGVKIVLDSGAYSAWTKGAQLCVKEYCAFIKEHAAILQSYFTLDVIGDPEATAANTAYMRAQGLQPTPVYHVQSDISVLAGIVSEGHSLIGIGGSAKMDKAERMAKLAEVFAAFPDQNFHLLAGGSADILNAFAWYSADATTWIKARKYNVIVDEAGQRKDPSRDPLECLAYTVRYYLTLEGCVA